MVLESDRGRIFGEERRMVYNYGKIEGNNFESIFHDVEVTKTVSAMMSKELKGHKVVGY